MVGLRILGSGFWWIGFWVVVASWNRRCFQDRSRRPSDSLYCDRAHCDFQRQFDGPLACSLFKPPPRCHHLKAAGAARSCSGRSLVHFCGGVRTTTQKWFGGQRSGPAMCRRLAGWLLRSRHDSPGHSQRPLVRQISHLESSLWFVSADSAASAFLFSLFAIARREKKTHSHSTSEMPYGIRISPLSR